MKDGPSPEEPANTTENGDQAAPATVEDLVSDLSDLTAASTHEETHEEVRDITELLVEANDRGLIDSRVRHLDARDAAEAFVGSVIFASPLLVEDGIFDIATHLFQSTIYGLPVFLIANTVFVVVMTYALLKWTGRNKAETRTIFGFVPVRLFMTLAVSFLVAALLMTVWGRVGGWTSPIEAIARINVIWTVGSLGAALGDILADNDTTPAVMHPETENSDSQPKEWDVRAHLSEAEPQEDIVELSDSSLVDQLHEEFDELATLLESAADRREVNRIRDETIQATFDDVNGRIQKYTSRDIAEGFIGSIFFSIPFLVEDGVYDVAAFFLSFQIGFFPVFFLLNAVFVILMIMALVYWAGPQTVQVSRPIFGFIPRRLVGISVVSFLTAAALMTMWGRVGNWEDPVVALARISVVWTVASFGASLGDILPGESSGDDINDDLAALGDLGGGDEETS